MLCGYTARLSCIFLFKAMSPQATHDSAAGFNTVEFCWHHSGFRSLFAI